MIFEKISTVDSRDVQLPVRKTKDSAGYDFAASETVVIPSAYRQLEKLNFLNKDNNIITLKQMEDLTKETGIRPTLVPTGVKAQIDKGFYLQLSVRSSFPLKSWIILANGVGIIDGDYYNNPANEGNIMFQLINLSPFDIIIDKGEFIGQGIILPYLTTQDDNATGKRVGGFGSTDV